MINDNKMPSIAPVITSLAVCLFIFTLAQLISGISSKANRRYPPYMRLKAVVRAAKDATWMLALIFMFMRDATIIPSMIPSAVIERMAGPFKIYKFIKYTIANSPPVR